MAWLDAAAMYETRDEHFKARLDRQAGGVVSLAARRAGREEARAMPEMQEVLWWEAAPNAEEPEALR